VRDTLEKRVKSRLSHRKVVLLAPTQLEPPAAAPAPAAAAAAGAGAAGSSKRNSPRSKGGAGSSKGDAGAGSGAGAPAAAGGPEAQQQDDSLLSLLHHMLLLPQGTVQNAGWLQRYDAAVGHLLADASLRVGAAEGPCMCVVLQ
jgi:hypothetical protein